MIGLFSRIVAMVLLITGFTAASAQSPSTRLIIDRPDLLVEAPVDPAITIERIGGGSFSEQALASIPYTIVLTNNTTHDIIGLAVRWVGVGPTPQTRLWD